MIPDNLVFVTSFNANGYHLYGSSWLETFIVHCYKKGNNPNIKAKIYLQGMDPPEEYANLSCIEWIKYDDAITNHSDWINEYNKKSNHIEYIKKMTIRFSHKAFVIQHALENKSKDDDYIIWLDGDCIFRSDDWEGFPLNILQDRFLACQRENSIKSKHIESGILIFNAKHSLLKTFLEKFKHAYTVNEIIKVGEPYDGYILGNVLNHSDIDSINKLVYRNLCDKLRLITDNPDETFSHPEIKYRFRHNIGLNGKKKYKEWNKISENDDIFRYILNFNMAKETHKENRRKNLSILDRLKRADPNRIRGPNISYVVITNANDVLKTKICLTSILSNFSIGEDEIILVGDVEQFKDFNTHIKLIEEKDIAHSGNISKLRNIGNSHAKGKWIIQCDDDLILPPVEFRRKFNEYKNHFDVFNTKILLPNGGRYWDRCIYNENKENHLVDYDYDEDDLFYTGGFLCIKKDLIIKHKWNEDLLFYDKHNDNEDVDLTRRLLKDGYKVNIDIDNFIFHYDETVYRIDDYIMKIKDYDSSKDEIVVDNEMANIFDKLLNDIRNTLQ
jgi:glycosyltransferase involved in cell wall biosynthesis